jgi:hypothetical protein
MKHHSRKLRVLTGAATIVALLIGVMFTAFAPEARAAEGDPNVSVATKTEHIDGSATSFVVPITFDKGTHGDPNVSVATKTEHIDGSATSFVVPITFDKGTHDDVSSVSFLLDYDQACVRIDNTSTDITRVASGFASTFSNDRDAGKLQVSIWRNGAQSALSSGTLISIKFTLEPACRPGALNLTDPTTAFTFIAPLPTFGSTLGANIPGGSTSGTYTLDINQAPTDISASDLAMAENVSGARTIATLAAADIDAAPADVRTFAFSGACGGVFDNQGFVLDPVNATTTSLRTDRVFDFEGVDSYAICVQVTDGQGGAYVETLTLGVEDANDAPVDIALSANTIAQGATAGTTVGTLTTTDEDDDQDFTYALVESGEGSADSTKFTIAGDLLKINSPVDYLVQPEYRVRIQSTDDGDPAKSVTKQFRVLVNGVSVLALPGEPDVPAVVAGEQVVVPLSFSPNGNNVKALSFQVNYNETCLNFVELTNIQAGYSDGGADVADDGHVNVSLTTAGQAPLSKGAPLSLVFEGAAGCAPASSWVDLSFEAAPTMTGSGGTPFVTTSHAGKLVVLPADDRGDCNADDAVNAGDFSATALELFDIESTDESGDKPAPKSWLWTPLGDQTFSARGCDSNADRTMQVSDLQCTVRLFFGATCMASASVGAAAAPAPAPAIVSVPAAVTAGQGTAVPLVLQTNTHDVSAFAASVSFDPAELKLDPTDSDADGVPDAVHFQLPAGMYRMAAYDAAAGTVDLVATGVVMPLPTLPDGVLVTLTLTAVDGAAGTATALTLDNLSLGDSAGGSVPAVVETTSPLSTAGRVFLPAVMQ